MNLFAKVVTKTLAQANLMQGHNQSIRPSKKTRIETNEQLGNSIKRNFYF